MRLNLICQFHRRATHGGRFDHRGKGRFNSQDVDGWRKKSISADSSSVAGSSNVELSSNVHVQDCNSPMQDPQKSGLHHQGSEDEESGLMSDPIDSQAQVIFIIYLCLLGLMHVSFI